MTIKAFADVDVDKWSSRLVPFADALVLSYFSGCAHGGVGLFVLDPGQCHPAHVDLQPPEWVTRVHVPLETNPYCGAWSADTGFIEMKVGTAYTFDTRVEHAVANAGKTKRVHLVFDVKRK